MEDLMQQADKYEYIRFVCADFNGIGRGKVATTLAKEQICSGMGIYGGIIAISSASECPFFLEKDERIGQNGYLIPATDVIHPVPWAANGKYRVGELICEMTFADGSPLTAVPRTLAQKQLYQLERHGLKLLSAFEVECVIVSKDNLKPLFRKHPVLSFLPLSMHEEMLYEFDQKFRSAGIDLENIQCEYSPGQFEFSFIPSCGIHAPDCIIRFKEGLKEMCIAKNFQCTFMAKPFHMVLSNGMHFNFSLWTEDNQNAFYDSERPNNMSDICLHFIGGVLSHLPGLTAVCSPTVNCFRRLHQQVVPNQADWDIENRNVALRVKNDKDKKTYIECRLPSGCSNPYLVTAGVIAAGLDGLKHKTVPPPRGKGQNPGSLPHTLEEALTELEKDEVIKESFGELFMDWFVATKRKFEVSKFESHNMEEIIDKELDLEREDYFDYL